jgi:hypothetical protein
MPVRCSAQPVAVARERFVATPWIVHFAIGPPPE